MQVEQKVEKYESFTDLEEGVVAEGQKGWTAISFIQNMKFFYYVVLYRKSPTTAFSTKAAQALLEHPDPEVNDVGSEIVMQKWIETDQ